MTHRFLPQTALSTGIALAALIAAPALHAATPAADAAAPAPTATSMFSMAVPNPTRDVRYETPGFSSSSSSDDEASADPVSGERDSLAESYDAGQPPPGRRRAYGRSRYQDRLHNSDGSSKIAFMAGAGMNVPVGNTGKYYTPHLDIGVGGGINFNKMFGVLAEFRYDRMGLTGGSINYQYANYLADGASPDDLAGLDANAHTISITVDPVITFTNDHSKVGAYVTGGFGYYRKTTNFTLPQVGEACNTFFCQTFVQNQTFDSYSAGGIGANVGFGLTYKMSQFSSERLFAEARYQWMDLNSNNNQDFFPFNRRNTETLPVTVGIRF